MFEELLLIDPDQEILDAFKRFLTRHGFSVETAASGATATRQMRLSRPDLIVIEPVLSGDWDERIFEQYQHTAPSVPLIGLSKHASSRVAFPFIEYYVKPISSGQLLEGIRTALRCRALRMLN